MKTLVHKLILTTTMILCLTGYASAQNQVDGHLTYHNIWPMDNSTVQLMDMGGNVLQTASTNSSGYFLFDNVPSGDYLLTATTQLPAGGIDMGDAYLIMLHLFNMYPFSNIQSMTADVDGNGMVTWNDYFAIVVGWFTQGYPFPSGEWTFETINVSLNGSRDGATGNFGGSSTGDVNHSLIPDKAGNSCDFVIEEFVESHSSNSNIIELPVSITSHKTMGAAFIDLNYDESLNISHIEANVPNLHYNITDDEIRISWVNTEVNNSINEISLNIFLDINDLSIEDEFSFTASDQSHIVDNSGEFIHGVNLVLPTLKLEKGGVFELNEMTCKSYPNPFSSDITLEFNIQLPDSYKIVIHNSAGQIIHETNYCYLNEGQNELRLELANELPGLYFYNIINTNQIAVYKGSMIKL